MLTASQQQKIDQAVQEVARHGHGVVAIVVERGRARRVRMEIDLSWDKLRHPEQVLEQNNGTGAN